MRVPAIFPGQAVSYIARRCCQEMSPVRPVLTLGLAGALLAAGIAGSAQKPLPQPKRPAYGLPNLAMHEITDVSVAPLYTPLGERLPGRWGLRFTATLDNVGRGHFLVYGSRERAGEPCSPVDEAGNQCEAVEMQAEQRVIEADGTVTSYPDLGSLFFHAPHNHWHLRSVERFFIATMAGKSVTTDAKTGFCLGDRLYYTLDRPPNYPGLRNDLQNCEPGSGDPQTDGRRKLSVFEGISSGWSDDYPSYTSDGEPLEGQQLEITDLPAGAYRLVNVANPDGVYRETTRRDNAASVLFRLTWPGGSRPSVEVRASCVRTQRCTRKRAL